MKVAHEDQLNQQRQIQEKEKQEALARHQKQMQDNENLYRAELHNQKSEFQKSFDYNERTNREIIEGQKDRLLSALQSQKKELLDSSGKYLDKKDDPFYRLKSAPSVLKESPWAYVLEVQIPESQKDDIDVVVKENQLVVSGTRRYEDQIEEGDHKVTTNNYQSYREAIDIDHPAVEKAVTKEYKDGLLTVRIPKMGMKPPSV